VRAVATIGEARAVLGELPEAGAVVTLELRTSPPSGPAPAHVPGPDEIVAGVVTAGGGFHELGRLDGRYLSTETAGGFTGRVIGLTCARGDITVTSFTHRGADPAQA
jgi:hypothetical protein